MFSVSSIVCRSSKSVNSYSILGVSSSTSFDEIRSRFHELARLYHPDMAHGDPVKFREVHAAYRQLRALHRSKMNTKEKEAHQEQARKTVPSEELWERIRKAQRPKAPPTEAYTWKSEHNRVNRKKRVKLSDLLYETNGYEIIVLVGASFILLAYFFKRCAHFSRLAREKREFYERIEKGYPEPMPLTAETKLEDMYYEAIPTEKIDQKSSEIYNDVNNRKASQRRFDDFREFMYIFDAENVGERKVSTERFSYEYLNEKDVFTRCPIVYEFNSENKGDNYEAVVKQVQNKFNEIEWENGDAKYIGSLIALGLNGVSSVSPNTSKWTFIEYVDLDKVQKGKLPVCLAALHNHRYESVGMCQRVIVTGRKDLHHSREYKDKKNSLSDTFQKSHLITGLPIPLKTSGKFHAA